MFRVVILLLCLAFLSVNKSLSQRHQIGFSLGLSNYIGDIGSTYFVLPNSFSMGLSYKYVILEYTYIRSDIYFSNIRGYDSDSEENYRKNRNRSFNSSLFEFSFGLEHNFFKYDFNKSLNHTPYVFLSLGTTAFDKPTFVASHRFKRDYKNNIENPSDKEDFNSFYLHEPDFDYTFVIPFGVGYKMVIKRRWHVSLELGFRYVFSDDLDASGHRIKKSDIENGLGQTPFLDVMKERDKDYLGKFGNTKYDDIYVFSFITLSYSFGEYVCPCWD